MTYPSCSAPLLQNNHIHNHTHLFITTHITTFVVTEPAWILLIIPFPGSISHANGLYFVFRKHFEHLFCKLFIQMVSTISFLFQQFEPCLFIQRFYLQFKTFKPWCTIIIWTWTFLITNKWCPHFGDTDLLFRRTRPHSPLLRRMSN